MTDVPEVLPDELAHRLEAGERLQILDVRAPHRLAAGAIEPSAPATFTNLPNSALFALEDAADSGLAADAPVITVCGHGNSSKQAARWLLERGYQTQSLRGGMAAWMDLIVPRDVTPPAGFTHFIQFDRLGKGSLAYLLIADDEALIVDAPRDASRILATVEDAGARVVAAADTHVHADYISGSPALSARLGVPYYLHPADAIYPYDDTPGMVEHTALSDGQPITVGRSMVDVMHTPGHTEGSVTYLAAEAALTGDFLFVDSIGRPDLAGRTAEWGAQLWTSLEHVRGAWSPDVTIYPGHYASDHERRADRVIAARFGDLPARNPVHRMTERDVFLQWIVERQREAPDAYRQIKAVNVGLAAVSDDEASMLEAGKNECAVA